MTAPHTDLAGLTGGWVNFDTTALGIRLVDAVEDEGRLALSIAEAGPGAVGTRTALTATPLVDAGGDGPAVGFLAEARLGTRDVILCGYLNRGLLTIDVHTAHPDDQRAPNTMYRAHYYRPGPARPSGPPEGVPLP
ncbi:hypothetical protein JIX56_08655 [Streptomyces sp. CA-210063]|uniref:hypothetical protein n=1 Tax=Streptomyces sp. CA-210063 TaxID=2801029 RepID=UPI00214C8718|nr:hypothetical protein [Streptomyces sp. CA-210063]UUU29949.1 hypothetical protein JIX56_08655 [Streptomyces sp. CA-210063]